MNKNNRVQIRVGTCIPGDFAEKWIPMLSDSGFETMSINFHMSLGDVDIREQGPKLKDICGQKSIDITTIGYYCNAIQFEEHKKTLEEVIDNAHLYGANIVSTFAGAYENQPVEESFGKFGEVFGELSRRAEDRGVKIGIENCPMGGTWRSATCNIGFNPRAWERMFNEVPSDALGLEWEPAHQMIQLIDPIPQLRKWIGKVVHVHGKDANIDRRAVEDGGILLGEDAYVQSRTPGFGDTDWRDIFYILYTGGYDGDICIEGYHDPLYNRAWEMTGQLHALNYLKWCRGGDIAPTLPSPW